MCKDAQPMNWDDLRFVATVARRGSLLAAARELGVDHTTVGRRVAAAEAALGITLFVRSTVCLSLTADAEALLAPLQAVEDAVHGLVRVAGAGDGDLTGTVKVTAPESFGIAWLAPRLAEFARQHQGLHVELDPSGAVLDLSRREAEIALRHFRSNDAALVSRHAADVGHGLYATKTYLARYPVRGQADLAGRPFLMGPPGDLDTDWLLTLAPDAKPVFTCVVAVALVAAARTGAGLAVLPRFLGDAEPDLVHLPMPNEPRQALWLHVHRDLRKTPRVRAVLDYLSDTLTSQKADLRGR